MTNTHDEQDVIDLYNFVKEKKRTYNEINGLINCFAHVKYSFGKTQKGHELRKNYKNWLRRQLKKKLKKEKKELV